jgi:hypothetical protein
MRVLDPMQYPTRIDASDDICNEMQLFIMLTMHFSLTVQETLLVSCLLYILLFQVLMQLVSDQVSGKYNLAWQQTASHCIDTSKKLTHSNHHTVCYGVETVKDEQGAAVEPTSAAVQSSSAAVETSSAASSCTAQGDIGTLAAALLAAVVLASL